MMWKRSRIGLLACGVLAALTVSVRAGDCCGTPAPVTGDCGAPCAPVVQYRTVCVTEWVPEYYQTTRTVLKAETVAEKYTAYRTEVVPTPQTRTYTINRCVPEVQTRTRTVMVPTTEVQPRQVTRCVVNYVPVTTTCTRVVDRGHYECREVTVPCGPAPVALAGGGHGGRKGLLGGLCHRGGKHGHGGCGGCETACASPCGDGCGDCGPTFVTKTVNVWVPNCVTESYPVTRMERQVSNVTETINVTVCRMVPREETFQVTVNRIVPETKTETITVNVCRTVPYEATRMVTRCVPVTENVTACRMVPRVVEKQVPCGGCEYGAGYAGVATSCCGGGHHGGGHKLFGGGHGGGHKLFGGGHHGGGCCN